MVISWAWRHRSLMPALGWQRQVGLWVEASLIYRCRWMGRMVIGTGHMPLIEALGKAEGRCRAEFKDSQRYIKPVSKSKTNRNWEAQLSRQQSGVPGAQMINASALKPASPGASTFHVSSHSCSEWMFLLKTDFHLTLRLKNPGFSLHVQMVSVDPTISGRWREEMNKDTLVALCLCDHIPATIGRHSHFPLARD